MRILKEDEIDLIMFMTHNHKTGGHLGTEAVYGKIVRQFYWKGMYNDICEYIKRCDTCQRRGSKGGKEYLNPISIEEPFERIGLDFIEPLPKTKKGNKYILVMTDYLTKWPEAKAMKEATSENVIEFIYKKIICRHGCPKIILTDRGAYFNNRVVDGLCRKFEIKHKLSSPYHSETNGLVERFNRTLCESLAKVTEKEENWDQYIQLILFAYRRIKQNTTKRTPFYMMHGREAKLPTEEIEKGEINFGKGSTLKRIYELINLEEEHEETRRRIIKSQEKQKRRHDENIKEETKFKIGDKVLLKDAAKEKQWTGKLSPKWKGPYYIHRVIGKGAYKLRTLKGKVLKASYNIKHLKKYYDQRDISSLQSTLSIVNPRDFTSTSL